MEGRIMEHLEAWLEYTFHEEDALEAKEKILKLCEEEPDIIDRRSWPEILKLAEKS